MADLDLNWRPRRRWRNSPLEVLLHKLFCFLTPLFVLLVELIAANFADHILGAAHALKALAERFRHFLLPFGWKIFRAHMTWERSWFAWNRRELGKPPPELSGSPP